MEVSIVPNDFQTSLFDIDLIRLFRVSYQPRPRDLQYVKIWGRIILWFDRYVVQSNQLTIPVLFHEFLRTEVF